MLPVAARLLPLLGMVLVVPPARAQQDAAAVEAIAPILMAEDARRWDEGLFRRGLEHPDPAVRKRAALAVGRIRDTRGTPLLLEHLQDPDSTVQTELMFALGLLEDSAAVAPIINRFTSRPGLWREAALEGITALARIRDPRVTAFFSGVLRRIQPLTVDTTPPVLAQVARELWRQGSAAPVLDLIPFLKDSVIDLRQGAVFSVSRLRPPAAGSDLLLALGDELPPMRGWAARALTRAYADTASLSGDAVITALSRLLVDEDAGVRINALRSLGTFGRPELSSTVLPLLGDPHINTRVQAAATLGQTGGPAATEALVGLLRSRDAWAIRREALLSLARVDTAAFLRLLPDWIGSPDWSDRAVAVQALAVLPAHHPARPSLEREPDGRVVAAALQAWSGAALDSALVAHARRFIGHPDAAVRSVSADILARVTDPADVRALVASYQLSARDSFPDAALSVLNALDTIAAAGPAAAERVAREFLDLVPRPNSYLLRRWAEESWPDAADRWGAAFPIETGRTLEDYRELARRFVVGNDPARYPHVFLETEQRGIIELELYGPEAPLTVANFLMLVDRHYFDGNSWHRVVPNFVVQDGDRRGDGWGGPGGEIRDEINRRRYDKQVLGMALSGPDTGSSQWFITHNAQPHLDGTYTVFGRVVNGAGVLNRITQGDRIKTIRR
jgi:cyclophilin family peptidyl-prolyl cis-trans isomerase/HEAT repeat protein